MGLEKQGKEAKEGHKEAGEKGKMFGLEETPKYQCLMQVLPLQGKPIH